MADPHDAVNPAHGRDKEYRAVLERIQRDGNCPFCWEHFLTYHTEPILEQTERWIVTSNFRPYAPGITQLLLVPDVHCSHLEELPPGHVTELFELLAEMCREHKLPGGTLLMRSGDTDTTGGSVTHLHAQWISGGSSGAGGEPICPVVGYGMPPGSLATRERE